MTAPRHAVKVVIGGEEFTVRSELSPEYTREVAAHFDRMLAGIRASLPTVEAHKAAILAGLAVTDELFQARRADTALAARLVGLAEDVSRLLPPGRRGAGGASAES
ncbi:MAG TPA: cell division protein ZapA [Gemmatimonadales bacterium]|nr:cell division protein ZapA [Gemmatimonadales bacterium]